MISEPAYLCCWSLSCVTGSGRGLRRPWRLSLLLHLVVVSQNSYQPHSNARLLVLLPCRVIARFSTNDSSTHNLRGRFRGIYGSRPTLLMLVVSAGRGAPRQQQQAIRCLTSRRPEPMNCIACPSLNPEPPASNRHDVDHQMREEIVNRLIRAGIELGCSTGHYFSVPNPVVVA